MIAARAAAGKARAGSCGFFDIALVRIGELALGLFDLAAPRTFLQLRLDQPQRLGLGQLLHDGDLAGDAIERLAEVDTIIFDKTGTLTLPEPTLVEATMIAPATLQLAARLARASHHPLARALAQHALVQEAPVGAEEIPGGGVKAVIGGDEVRLGSAAFCGVAPDAANETAEGDGESMLFFVQAGKITRFRIRQNLRSDAAATVQRLRAMGYTIKILSGDRPAAVAAAAEALNVADWQAGMKPADKIAALAALKAKGRKVLMVGDGLNDAPALAAAHVSLAPVTAADLAQAATDAIFVGDRLAPVAECLAIGRKAHRLMRQNLALAVVYNTVAVPLAMAGLVTPLIAACAMSGSSLLVTTNAMRAGGVAGQRVSGAMPAPDERPQAPGSMASAIMEARS